ncbi:helix-turn-helix transcriptional regulator [Micromonospora sp. NPDC047730]|uniref:helix-turn-helix transcriptional regulator n=1 Tax=Micromonospora sp. NPDC047730 TaxID=3364253 RepID=UPI0037159621
MERYRRTERLTWEEMAKAAGVGRQTLNNLRDSKESPRLRTVHKIAAAIGMDQEKAEALAGIEPVEPVEEETEAAPEATGDPAVDARSAIMRDPRLNDRSRKLMLDVFDAIAARFDDPAPPQPAADDNRGHRRAS